MTVKKNTRNRNRFSLSHLVSCCLNIPALNLKVKPLISSSKHQLFRACQYMRLYHASGCKSSWGSLIVMHPTRNWPFEGKTKVIDTKYYGIIIQICIPTIYIAKLSYYIRRRTPGALILNHL